MAIPNPEQAEHSIPLNFFHGFTPSASEYYFQAITEYAERLKSESLNIEKMEHVGEGLPEITTAHIEEAKWVLIRRLRRRASLSKKILVPRFFQYAATLLLGLGASNYSQLWGSLLTLVSLTVGFIAFAVETENSREY